MKYFELLLEGKIEEAELLRISENPRTLYKYVSLDGTPEDEKRYDSLANNTIWFSSVDSFNDPYEHKGMILDKELLSLSGFSDEIIEEYNELFVTDDLEVACLSASGPSNLPMWAYYSNN